MQCRIHGNRVAVGTCAYCGQPFCQACLVNLNGVSYCKEDVSKVLNLDEKVPLSRAETVSEPKYYEHHHYHLKHHHYHSPLPNYYYKNKAVALLLCIFFGVGGFHRFYVGKIGTGLLYLFSGGLFGFGWFIDIISILLGNFTDANGYRLM